MERGQRNKVQCRKRIENAKTCDFPVSDPNFTPSPSSIRPFPRSEDAQGREKRCDAGFVQVRHRRTEMRSQTGNTDFAPLSFSDSLLDTLSLPHLSFDTNLLLVHSNLAARKLFGIAEGKGRHLSGFLRRQEEVEEGLSNGAQAMMVHEIQTLAAACVEKEFGKGVRLKVWAGEGMERRSGTYQIHVQRHEGDSVGGGVRYTMLFLRPAISKLDLDPENGAGGEEMDMEDSEISPQTFDALHESLLGVQTKLRAERLEEIVNNLPQYVSSPSPSSGDSRS